MSTLIETQSAAYVERLRHRQNSLSADLWNLLDRVKDPEIPVISLWDLGILQDIEVDDQLITVIITPTYSGCPAMVEITEDIYEILRDAGYQQIKVTSRLMPAWTTDWMSSEGRTRLREYGIAPPACHTLGAKDNAISCPQCDSLNVALVSEFGSTSCKALYQCQECKEPFDYFKCI